MLNRQQNSRNSLLKLLLLHSRLSGCCCIAGAVASFLLLAQVRTRDFQGHPLGAHQIQTYNRRSSQRRSYQIYSLNIRPSDTTLDYILDHQT